jgi:hypothetical protein
VKGQDLSFTSELELVPEVEPQNFEGVRRHPLHGTRDEVKKWKPN